MLVVEVKGRGKDQLLLLMAKLIKYQYMQDLEINSPPSSSFILPPISSSSPLCYKPITVLLLLPYILFARQKEVRLILCNLSILKLVMLQNGG